MVLRSLTGVGHQGLTALVPALPSSLVLAGTRSIDGVVVYRGMGGLREPWGYF